MKINAIEIFRVVLPYITPFKTACGDEYNNESVIVRIESDNISGYGEAASMEEPLFSHECGRTQFIISRDFIAPALLGQSIATGHDLQNRIAPIKGNQFAKAAFDLAWWDLYARKLSKPLWQVIGGQNPAVNVGADFGIMNTIEELLDHIAKANESGYKRIKLKCRPGWDLAMIQRVRKSFPKTTIHLDCNSAYSLNDIDLLKSFDQFNLAMLEQPLAHDDLIDHATLQSQIKTPICLDESITSLDKTRKAIQINACRWVNIKLSRVGGLTNAIDIHNYCQSNNIPCWIGSMLESGIGLSHALAAATLSNIAYPCDIFPSGSFYAAEIATPEITISAPSQIIASSRPGIGVEPDSQRLNQFTIEHALLQI